MHLRSWIREGVLPWLIWIIGWSFISALAGGFFAGLSSLVYGVLAELSGNPPMNIFIAWIIATIATFVYLTVTTLRERINARRAFMARHA